MHRKLIHRLVLIAVAAFAAAANAQFTSSNGSTTTADAVGIGFNAAPWAKFQVFGIGSQPGMMMKVTASTTEPYGFYVYDTSVTEGYPSGTLLSLTGNSLIRVSNLQIGATGTPLIQSMGASPLYLNTSSNNDVVIGQSAFATGLKVDSIGTSYFRGKLGVGTTSPLSAFHTNGTLTVGSASSAGLPGMVQVLNGGAAPIANRLAFGTDGSGWKFAIAKNQGGTLSDLLAVQDNGNVGIGTTSPAQRLSVAGVIESTSGGFKFPDGSTQTSAYGSGGNITVSGPAPLYTLKSTASTQSSTVSTDGAGLYINVFGHATPANNFIAFGTTNVASSSQAVEVMRINSSGQVAIGTQTPAADAKLDVHGNVNVTGTLTATSVMNAVYGQDVAEWVRGDRDLAAGTVVVVNPEKTNEVMPSSTAYDTTVAGVVSAQPGIILGRSGALKATVATSGRVRVRVDARKGAIHMGDLLVTSDEPGTAMKSQPMEIGGRKFHQPGTILGKALEPLNDGVGEILVLLCLG